MDDRPVSSGELAGLVRAHRRMLGLSQRELADRAAVGVAVIRDLEQGRTRRPHPRTTEALITALGLTAPAAAAVRVSAVQGDWPCPVGAASSDIGESSVDQPLRVHVLGPLSVRRGSRELALGRGKRRAVLGRLALTANTTVLVAELIDLLWGVDLPAAPEHVLHSYISRLRAALAPAGRADDADGHVSISRVPGGYRLGVAEELVDLVAFRRFVRDAARAEAPARVMDLLETALRCWNGDSPASDVPELRAHPLAVAAVDERTQAILRHADLAIPFGRADRCLPLLRLAVAVHPLNEPLHARLVTALSADNRQAEALSVHDAIRRRLADELGVRPHRSGQHRSSGRRTTASSEHAGPA